MDNRGFNPTFWGYFIPFKTIVGAHLVVNDPCFLEISGLGPGLPSLPATACGRKGGKGEKKS